MAFYITSKSWNVLGDELEVTLCEYQTKIEWHQPWFERQWFALNFDTEIAALNCLQKLYPERKLTVFEDTGKVLSTWGHESSFTSMKIRKVKEY